MALLLYAVTLFISAFLLFLVQPIVGAKILPKLGGTPSVWNTCVVFFQMALLVGYGYTHFTSKLPVRRQILIHALLLFVPFLILLPNGPFGVEGFRPVTGGNPIPATLMLLATIVGIPFFVVSTTAPLLQKWFGSTGHPAAKDPYFLYGASNLGSMLSLLLYPFVFEPLFGLEAQSWLYTYGFMGLVALVLGCAVMAFMAAPTVLLPGKRQTELDVEKVPSMAPEPPPAPITDIAAGPAPAASQTTAPLPSAPAPVAPKPVMATAIKKGGKKSKGRDLAKSAHAPATAIATPAAAAAIAASSPAPSIARPSVVADPDEITWLRRLRWVGLAAVPSSLMLGVIMYVSTDVSAIPLFWVMPLALYLLSFILVFMRSPINWLDQAHTYVIYLQPALLALLALFMSIASNTLIVQITIVMLVAFMFTALACHGEMAKDRPSVKHLTEFYLWMSVGGALGGFFNAIVAPVIFTKWGIVEFGLALAAAGLLRPVLREHGWLESLMDGSQSFGGSGKHGKGGKKIAKSSSEMGSLTLILDFAVPVVLLAIMAVLMGLIIRPDPNSRSFTGQMVACVGVPLALAAFFFDRPLRFGLTLAGVLLAIGIYHNSGAVEFQTRTYFGVLRVRRSAESYGQEMIPYTSLTHGTTHHGMALEAIKGLDLSRVATTYYHRQGPVGLSMERFIWFSPSPRQYEITDFSADLRMPASLVGLGQPGFGISLPMNQLAAAWSEPGYGVIGMGTATMASYGRPFQTCHFFEIDEQIRLFSLPEPGERTYFGYVKAAQKRGTNVKVLMGDARLRMAMPWVPEGMTENDPTIRFDQRGGAEYFYHLIVVDAFSSDAIPRHLITKEAMEMYFKHLVQGRWGPWLKVSETEIGGKKVEVDERGFQVDSVPPRFLWEERKEGGKVVAKRAWYPGGVLCVHTSNRHLELVPVVADTAGVVVWNNIYDGATDIDGNNIDAGIKIDPGKSGKQVKGLSSTRGHDLAPGHQTEDRQKRVKEDIGHFTSEWVIVARDEKDLKYLNELVPSKYTELCRDLMGRTEPYWTPQNPGSRYIWTDDHSNLMAVFRWPWQSRH